MTKDHLQPHGMDLMHPACRWQICKLTLSTTSFPEQAFPQEHLIMDQAGLPFNYLNVKQLKMKPDLKKTVPKVAKKMRHDQSHTGLKDIRAFAKKKGNGKFNWGSVEDDVKMQQGNGVVED